MAGLEIGDKGVEHLSRMLIQNRSIKKLNLTENNITTAGFQDITDALRSNTTLAWLDLHDNRGLDDGVHPKSSPYTFSR